MEAIKKKKNKPLESHTRSRFGLSGSNKPLVLPFPSANSNWKSNKKNSTKNTSSEAKFVPGHECEGQLFSLVVLPTEELEEKFQDAEEELGDLKIEELPQMSLNAFTGASSFRTMRVIEIVCNKYKLYILIDSGSTHNFLEIKVDKQMGCKIIPTSPLSITVAGVRHLMSVSECLDFTWQLKGETFVTDVMLLPLDGCEMVLEIGDKWYSQEPSSMVNEKEASINDGLCSTRAHDDVVRLNKNTIKYKFTIPISASVFSKLDLKSGYHQINQYLFTYEKELLVVILALEKWMGYLLDRHFVIKSDHGSDNGAVNASSRLENQSALFSLTTFTISTDLFQRIVNSWDGNLKKSLNVCN
ncbi:gypsy/ty3 retroelement polyprotein [Tanacetum coccineum]